MKKYLLLFFALFSQLLLHAAGNDECANATTIIPGFSCDYTIGTFSGMSMNGATPSCATESLQDVWYKFTATDATMSISLNAVPGLNHGFEIIQGGCNGTILACVSTYITGYGENYFNNNFVPGQEYYVRVFNATAQLSASNFAICVQKYTSPENDTCANATPLTPGYDCSYTYGTFSGAMMNGAIPSCGSEALQDVWYKFTATDATMSISLSSQNGLNHGFEIIQGGCNGTVLKCVNTYIAGNGEFYINNNFIVGQEYYVRVFNATAQLSTLNFGICIQRYPSPGNDTCTNATPLTPGYDCNYTYGTFSGAMMNGTTPSCGSEALQDVWYKFTATDATMSIALSSNAGLNPGFEIIQGGCNGTVFQCVNTYIVGYSEFYINNNFVVGQEYHVRVFNDIAQLSTLNFGICVQRYPSPVNDTCTNATPLTPGYDCNYTYGTFSGAMMNGGTPSCGNAAIQDIWYKFTATDATMSIALSSQTGLNHGFEIIQGGCNGTVLQCVNTYIVGNSEFYINNNFVAGQEYYVRVFNDIAQLSLLNFGICIQRYPSPPNDICANATELTPGNTCNYTYGTFSGAMMNGATPSCGTAAVQDIWYKFTATDSTMGITLSSNAGLNQGFEIIQGGCNAAVLQCVNTYIIGIGENYTNNNFVTGQEYYIRIFNDIPRLSTLNFGICLTGPAPTLCTPSVAITASKSNICNGETVVFNAISNNGGNAPSYQWKVNGNNVGTNSATFTTNTLTNNSVVSCVLTSNAACASPLTATSNSIVITTMAPVVPVFSQIAPICPGDPLLLPGTSANGVSGMWTPAANNIATTLYTFIPSSAQCAENTTMTIVVKSVNTATTTQGNTITASAAGATYQWVNCSSAQPISGATNATYTATQDGSYAVMVTQNGCTATSACVTIATLGTDTFSNNKWNMYPNPATHQLFINLNEATEIAIIDMTGKIIHHQILKAGKNAVDISLLTSGMYIIKSASGVNAKFIKK
ncbi:hypothetical protein FNO01nite_25980 [Flavobacterium noncentrifugens]|uniref:Por secretion system C-terminal sorting domain-containing protein n=1 Tax=Flavobacterium noncentrifugens TaxID=1128970 RepID=A0A1G8ZHH7_9FLAO|nr:T9SS type A sorting domain-containing protein [Flavobacterium noncentrifugens]GEP51926.1 hypothetical protein FNO01nite_25980 [Flavobacterium noncentrifugens]SDK14576.1 Por secretion system C-terminal sorting domain-containing protein [Flavobacterium noncentrifugens]